MFQDNTYIEKIVEAREDTTFMIQRHSSIELTDKLHYQF